MHNLFITATGTDIGKTLVTSVLCHQLISQGNEITALKPIVSGFTPNDLESDPALILAIQNQEPTPAAIAAISPWRFSAPLSPHLAARRESRGIDLDQVVAFCRRHEQCRRTLLVEGAGGLMSPLNDHATNLDLIEQLAYPVILVTGTYLGSMSHTLTAYQTLSSTRAQLQAIIVSDSIPSAGLSETVETLQQFTNLSVPVIPLPRLAGTHSQKCRSAPNLLDTIVLQQD